MFLKPSEIIFIQAVSKYVGFFNAYFDGKANDPMLTKIIDSSLNSEQFEYHGGIFFSHTPEELKEEIEETGFEKINILSVESLGRGLNIGYWEDENLRKDLLYFIEKSEKEPSIIGISAHIMAIGQKK